MNAPSPVAALAIADIADADVEAPVRQKSGLGRAIMNAAEAWLRAAGLPKLQLLGRRENSRAAAFYRSIGYAEADTIVFAKWIDGRTKRPRRSPTAHAALQIFR